MDWAVIRIRDKDLSNGLHAKAHNSARQCRITIYLQPGLTGNQRKAALRRLRLEASRGYGPALPASQLSLALGADKMRVTFRRVTGVIRLHPAASLLPAVITSTLVALFVLVSVSVRIMHLPLPGVTPGSAPATRAGDPARALPAGPPGPGSGPATGVNPGSRGQPGAAPLTPTRGSSAGGTGLGSGAPVRIATGVAARAGSVAPAVSASTSVAA
jgi:hypothetical protein